MLAWSACQGAPQRDPEIVNEFRRAPTKAGGVVPAPGFPCIRLAGCTGDFDLVLGMFRIDSKKFQKISENIGIKLVIVSPMV